MDAIYSKLKIYLEEYLKDKQPLIEPLPSNTAPLFLLLTVKPDLVGFAMLDDQPGRNGFYNTALQNFKELYATRPTEWANFDLTLVFCKTNNERRSITGELCNKIEVDPYFCRKFVIDLSRDPKSELGRLPFVPLHPENIVGLKRPVPAQSFLIKHGIPADLARYLVVPQARGTERIIKDCIEKKFAIRKWYGTEKEDLFSKTIGKAGHTNGRVRLKELEISNFRAYKGEPDKFDLDADLIVLYGPNGFGKTSFFDAIDFVSTGGVARFDERFGRKRGRLLKVLKHLDSSIEDSFVKAKILMGGREVTIKRDLKNRTNAIIDEANQDRTETLEILTGISGKMPDIRIENLVRLFRATHLFGQEYQSLTSEIRNTSNISEDTVSRMLALQDYVQGISKTGLVYEELKRLIRKKIKDADSLEGSLRSKEDEVKQLTKTAQIIVKKPETVLGMGKDIGRKIIQTLNIPIEIPEELGKKTIREWRAKIAANRNSFAQKLELVNRLETKLPELPDRIKILQDKTYKLNQTKRLLNELKESYSVNKKKVDTFNTKIKNMFYGKNSLSLLKDNLEWFLQAKIKYQLTKEKISVENIKHDKVQEELLGLAPNLEKMQFEKGTLKENESKLTFEIKNLRKRLQELVGLGECVDDWTEVIKRSKELNEHSKRLKYEKNNIKKELQNERAELNKAVIDRDRINNRISHLQRNQSDLHALLDHIERHLSSNICPVCGAKYKSSKELIEKLKVQRGIQPREIVEALKKFENAKLEITNKEKLVDALQSKIKHFDQINDEMEKELYLINEKIKTYREKAISLALSTDTEHLLGTIEIDKKEVSDQINCRQRRLSEQKSELMNIDKQFVALTNRKAKIEQILNSINSKQNQLESIIDQIRSDAAKRQLSMDLENDLAENQLATINKTIESLQEQITMQQAKKQDLQKVVNEDQEKRSILEHEFNELNEQVLHMKKYIEETENLMSQVGLTIDANMEQLMYLKKNLKYKLSSLDSLQNEIINFEVALDSAETSAVIARIKQNTNSIQVQLEHLETERGLLDNWMSYFETIVKELESVQNKALKEYTGKFGPLTSMIQKRLRSVYGFGDIKLHPIEGEIEVQVERGEGNNIHPTDYFSESQIQVVMLSLFLSAVLTQTWSSFAPILLDDPVEHFDDLNSYSLLDLIKGFITDPGRQHQFIISTCEERLFRLMRQKFCRMDSRPIFYIFESIGENGPKFRRL